MLARGGPVGWGQDRWWARFTCHLVYFRLTTLGLDRSRRAGFNLRASKAMA